ncbi:MAG: hypothetical protein ACJA1U_000783 [Bermanella sp.]
MSKYSKKGKGLPTLAIAFADGMSNLKPLIKINSYNNNNK